MSLELIIQEIKALGDLKVNKTTTNEEGEEVVEEQRRFRVKIGQQQFISKQTGNFVSPNHLYFTQPFSYMYDNTSHLLLLQIFKQHQYLDNSDLDKVLSAQVNLADLNTLHGDFIQSTLCDINKREVGKVVLTVQTFKKAKGGYFQKVCSKEFFQAVKEEYDRQVQVSQASKNIKNLMVNNTLADTLMTINAMTLITDKEDPQIFMKQGFVMVRYGTNIKAFTSMVKISSKQNANWLDYMQFLKNDGVKFQFFFFHFDDLGNIYCKAKGEIKYVIFDQTINLHTITLFDKRSNKYGVLMVKFNEKEVDKVKINNKVDKKVQALEPIIQEQLEVFNRYKFDNKFNNHILSQKMAEMELLEQQKAEERQRPMNPEQKKKQEEHGKFINFLQKQMIKIERELAKRENSQKKGDRRSMFLPVIDKRESRVAQTPVYEDRYAKKANLNSSFSSNQISKKTKFPKI